ncbi:MAG TPA: hypothetical protein VGP82_17580, partial [Ktedonobacterales bacterium]|nr:hypothetical protein [Ktedonobacterales bacterium]
VLAVFGFLIAHGASAAVIFKLRGERQVERIRVLLELSRGANSVANAALLVLMLAGVSLGFMGHWWNHLWIWAALGLLMLISVGMFVFGSEPLIRIRRVVQPDEPRRSNRKMTPAPPDPSTVSEQQLAALLAATRPALVTGIGGGGIALILWLMLFKPF